MSDKSSKRYDQSKVANDQQNKTGDQQLRTANTPGILKVDEEDTTISTFYRRMRGCDGLESPFTSLTHTFERSFTSIATKPHLPSVIDTMVERPEKGADGKYDELEKEEWLTLYKMHAKQKALVKIEAKKAFNIIRAWQDPSSIALCEKDKSYKQIIEEEDFVLYLELIRKTHIGPMSKDPAETRHNCLLQLYTIKQTTGKKVTDFNTRFNDLLERVSASGTLVTEEDKVEVYLSAISPDAKGDQYVSLVRQKIMPKPTKLSVAMEEACKYTPIAEYSGQRKSKSTSSYGVTAEESDEDTVAPKPAKGPGTCKHCKKYYNKEVKHYLNKCENYTRDMELLEASIKLRDGTSQVDKDFKPQVPAGTYVQTLGNRPLGTSSIGLGLGQQRPSGEKPGF
jgi:hypothetical protein